MKKNNDNRRSFFGMMMTNMFGGRDKMYMLEEELNVGKQKSVEEDEMQSPFMTTVRTFMSDKTAMFGLIVFIAIFLTVIIGPMFQPIDLSFSETSQQHVPPGYNLMKFPKELDGNIKNISVGPTYSIGIDNEGNPHIWGKTAMTRSIDIKNMPKDMKNIAQVSTGADHALALSEDGELFAWGADRQGQTRITPEIKKLDNIVDIEAGYQLSIVVSEDGHTYGFGNTNNNDYDDNHEYQGQIAKVTANADGILGLTKDGKAVYLGKLTTVMSKIPEIDAKVVDISSTSNTLSAVDENGQVYVWGNVSKSGLKEVPTEIDGKIVELKSGRNHYGQQQD